MEKQLNNEKPMRRRPWAAGFVIFLGLILSGGGYAAATSTVETELSVTDKF
jgi:ubiquinol-cytochrome c reductase cytochrome c subunit